MEREGEDMNKSSVDMDAAPKDGTHVLLYGRLVSENMDQGATEKIPEEYGEIWVVGYWATHDYYEDRHTWNLVGTDYYTVKIVAEKWMTIQGEMQ